MKEPTKHPVTENESPDLYAVLPRHLSHEPAPTVGFNAVKRVDFNYRLINRVIIALCLTFLSLPVWAWFTEIDDLTQARGQLIPRSDVQTVLANFDGRITSVNVKDGDFVRQGEIVVSLDKETQSAEVVESKSELNIKQAKLQEHQQALSILKDYLSGPPSLPKKRSSVSDVAAVIEQLYSTHQKLLREEAALTLSSPNPQSHLSTGEALTKEREFLTDQSRFRALSVEKTQKQFELEEHALSEKISALKHQSALQIAAVKQQNDAVATTKQQLAAYEEAMAAGASSKSECLGARMRLEEAKHTLTQAEERSLATSSDLKAATFELARLRSNHELAIAKMQSDLRALAASGVAVPLQMRASQRDLTDSMTAYQVALRHANSQLAAEHSEIQILQENIEQLKAILAAKQAELERTDIRAPVGGIVALMNLQGAGQVVQRGQKLLTVVPTEPKMVVRAYVPNSAGPYVHKGQAVGIQFPAYPYQQFRTVPGTIIEVSDAPAENKAHSSDYKIVVLPSRDYIVSNDRHLTLRKGLTANIAIVTRKQRLLDLWLAPLRRLEYLHVQS